MPRVEVPCRWCGEPVAVYPKTEEIEEAKYRISYHPACRGAYSAAVEELNQLLDSYREKTVW